MDHSHECATTLAQVLCWLLQVFFFDNPECEIDVPEYSVERVVQLMCDAGGKLSDGGEPFGISQLPLDIELFGYVFEYYCSGVEFFCMSGGEWFTGNSQKFGFAVSRVADAVKVMGLSSGESCLELSGPVKSWCAWVVCSLFECFVYVVFQLDKVGSLWIGGDYPQVVVECNNSDGQGLDDCLCECRPLNRPIGICMRAVSFPFVLGALVIWHSPNSKPQFNVVKN